MRLLLPFSVLLMCSMNLKAEYLYGEFSGTACTFCSSEIHIGPDTLSEKVVSLPAGTELQILRLTDKPYQANGLTSFWYEVSLHHDGTDLSGYIPGSCLAATSLGTYETSFFLYSVTGYDEESFRFSGDARIIAQGETVAETSIEPVADFWSPSSEYSYSVSSEIADPTGFTGVAGIYLLNFTYEACGYENRVTPVFNTGTQLLPGPSASSMFEAGIFHSTTSILLPSNSDVPDNTLILRTVLEEWNDSTSSYDTVETTDRVFSWTGSELEAM